jgi:hypothetical protein
MLVPDSGLSLILFPCLDAQERTEAYLALRNEGAGSRVFIPLESSVSDANFG